MNVLLRGALREAVTYALIAIDLVLGVLTALLILGLIPGDPVNFNVVGSLVLIVLGGAAWFYLDRYVQRRIAAGH